MAQNFPELKADATYQKLMGQLETLKNDILVVVLLHEKPFEGVNGSGKHNNWLLNTDDDLGAPREPDPDHHPTRTAERPGKPSKHCAADPAEPTSPSPREPDQAQVVAQACQRGRRQ